MGDVKQQIQLELDESTDDFGALFGRYRVGGRIGSIKLLPPAENWKGKYWREGEEPIPGYWVLYLDGRQAARVSAEVFLTKDILQLIGATIDDL